MTATALPTARAEISDAGRIRLGAGYKLPPVAPCAVADSGKIRMGAGYRRRAIAG